jgi:hypothetical protein
MPKEIDLNAHRLKSWRYRLKQPAHPADTFNKPNFTERTVKTYDLFEVLEATLAREVVKGAEAAD